jgi:D-inositol-3-phosphate glycosyltransferase
MDLAVVTPFPPRLTGIGQYGYHLSQALARFGFFRRVVVVTEGAGPTVLNTRDIEEWRSWPYDHPAVGLRLLGAIRRARADTVWVNFGLSMFGPSPAALLSGLAGLTVAALGGPPMVITLHEAGIIGAFEAEEVGVSPPGQAVLRLILRWAVRLGVVAVPLRSQAEELRRAFPGARVVCIPHGTFDPPEALPEPPTPAILFFGFVAPYKGLPTLLAAFERLQAANPSAVLEIAGAEHPRFPEYGPALRWLTGNAAGVRWSGPVPEAGVRETFGRSTVVALPYRAALGASSVLYRAATWGRPVVASELPAIRAAAAEAGLQVNWVPAGDARALAGALGTLLTRLDLREAQRRHNLRAVGGFTLEAVAAAYGRLLQTAGRQGIPSLVPEWG